MELARTAVHGYRIVAADGSRCIGHGTHSSSNIFTPRPVRAAPTRRFPKSELNDRFRWWMLPRCEPVNACRSAMRGKLRGAIRYWPSWVLRRPVCPSRRKPISVSGRRFRSEVRPSAFGEEATNSLGLACPVRSSPGTNICLPARSCSGSTVPKQATFVAISPPPIRKRPHGNPPARWPAFPIAVAGRPSSTA